MKIEFRCVHGMEEKTLSRRVYFRDLCCGLFLDSVAVKCVFMDVHNACNLHRQNKQVRRKNLERFCDGMGDAKCAHMLVHCSWHDKVIFLKVLLSVSERLIIFEGVE
jgi:hypothetical protein